MTLDKSIIDLPDVLDDLKEMPNAYKKIFVPLLNHIAQYMAFDAIPNIHDKKRVQHLEGALSMIDLLKKYITVGMKDEGEKVSLITRKPKVKQNLDKKKK